MKGEVHVWDKEKQKWVPKEPNGVKIEPLHTLNSEYTDMIEFLRISSLVAELIWWGVQERNILEIDYTNHRGERKTRRVKPIHLMFSENEWHKERQWLVEVYDYEKKATRTFAIKNIHSWKVVD